MKMCLLCNLNDIDLSEDVTKFDTAKCDDVIMKAMEEFKDIQDIQEVGCEYFSKIANLPGKKDELQEKKIVPLLAQALETFRRANNDEHFALANDALKLYLD